MKKFVSEEELKELYRDRNYNKLHNVRSKDYSKRTIGTYISKSIDRIDSSTLKETKKEMVNLIDKHIK